MAFKITQMSNLIISSKFTRLHCRARFNLESDFESTLDPSSLVVIAYRKDSMLNEFQCVTPETIQSDKFLMGRITPKRSADGHLRAAIVFNCQEESDDEQAILSTKTQTVTLALMRGNVNSHNLLHALAHFDVPIHRARSSSDATSNESADSSPIKASPGPSPSLKRHFDIHSFRQMDEPNTVFLPSKKRNVRTYYQPPPLPGENTQNGSGGYYYGGYGSGYDRQASASNSNSIYGSIFDEAEIALPRRK